MHDALLGQSGSTELASHAPSYMEGHWKRSTLPVRVTKEGFNESAKLLIRRRMGPHKKPWHVAFNSLFCLKLECTLFCL